METNDGSGTEIGLATNNATLTGNGLAGQAVMTVAKGDVSRIWVDGSDTGVEGGVSIVFASTVVGIAVDLDARKLWFRVTASGNWNNDAANNPAAGVGGIDISALIGTPTPPDEGWVESWYIWRAEHPWNPNDLFPFFGSTYWDSCTANFGGSAFDGVVPSGFTAGWPPAAQTIGHGTGAALVTDSDAFYAPTVVYDQALAPAPVDSDDAFYVPTPQGLKPSPTPVSVARRPLLILKAL